MSLLVAIQRHFWLCAGQWILHLELARRPVLIFKCWRTTCGFVMFYKL